jgi:MFS family permease
MNAAGSELVVAEPTDENVFSPLSASHERNHSKNSNRSATTETSAIHMDPRTTSRSQLSSFEVERVRNDQPAGHAYPDDPDLFSIYEDTVNVEHTDLGDAYNEWMDPWSPQNRGIFTSYFAVGFVIYFILTPLVYYLVNELDTSPTQQSVIMGLLELPWALKIFFGFITDTVIICGKRRKPHYVIGWGIYILCNMLLAALGHPNLEEIALLLFLGTTGFIQADVAMDAMIVERSKIHENAATRGTLQSTGYICRFAGSIIGALLGAVLYNKDSWGWGFPISAIFAVNAFLPFCCVAPFLYSLVEIRGEAPAGIRAQLSSMWALVQRRGIWQPCSFIYIYNVLYLTNPAWSSFLVSGLGFSNFDLGMLTLAATILSYVGIVVYKKFLFDASWRLIYVETTVMSSIFTLFQLVLVLKWNRAMGFKGRGGEMFFAIGSYGMVQLAQSIQVLIGMGISIPFYGLCFLVSPSSAYVPGDVSSWS